MIKQSMLLLPPSYILWTNGGSLGHVLMV